MTLRLSSPGGGRIRLRRCKSRAWLMTAQGQNRKSGLTEAISGLPPTTDIAAVIALVGFGPLSDSCSAAKGRLFDHLVRTAEYRDRHADAQRLGSLEIDHQFDLSGLLDWQVRRLFAFQNATSVDTGQAIGF